MFIFDLGWPWPLTLKVTSGSTGSAFIRLAVADIHYEYFICATLGRQIRTPTPSAGLMWRQKIILSPVVVASCNVFEKFAKNWAKPPPPKSWMPHKAWHLERRMHSSTRPRDAPRLRKKSIIPRHFLAASCFRDVPKRGFDLWWPWPWPSRSSG